MAKKMPKALDTPARQKRLLALLEEYVDACRPPPDADADFPLCDVFAPAAIYHLASGLVIDENEEMSDKFFDRYINAILDIRKELPASVEKIVDRYGLT